MSRLSPDRQKVLQECAVAEQAEFQRQVEADAKALKLKEEEKLGRQTGVYTCKSISLVSMCSYARTRRFRGMAGCAR